MELNDEYYDFIIVGAGTAGCVLARELIYNIPNINILVLEAGPPDTHINDIMRSPCAFTTVYYDYFLNFHPIEFISIYYNRFLEQVKQIGVITLKIKKCLVLLILLKKY